jgi:hypothetical protein
MASWILLGQRVQLELQRYEQRLHAECHVESMQQ